MDLRPHHTCRSLKSKLKRASLAAVCLSALAWILTLTTFPAQGGVSFQNVTPSATATATSTTHSAYPGPGNATEVYSTPTANTYPGPAGTQAPSATNAPFASATPRLVTSTPALLPTVPQAATLTPGGAATPSAVINPPLNLPATPTLVPLPALTMIFPSHQEAAPLVTATPFPTEPSSAWATPQRVVPLALIVMIWVILGAWFFYSQRNLS